MKDVIPQWPFKAKSLSTQFLRSLDDVSYKSIRRLIYQRELVTSGSKRHARNFVRKLDRRRRPYLFLNQSIYGMEARCLFLSSKCKDSEILDSLVSNRQDRWIETKVRTKDRTIELENFSFLDDPINTFVGLKRIAESELVCKSVRINFADKEMLDIGPYLVWGLMRERMLACIHGGTIYDGVRAAIDATELKSFLSIGSFGQKNSYRTIVPFRLRRRRSAGSSTSSNIAYQPSRKEKIGEELAEAVDQWLKSSGTRRLTPYGRARLYQLNAEILDNAERHARPGGDGDWALAGLMDRRSIKYASGTRSMLVCNFAFVNVGLTISETLSNAEDKITRDDLRRYCNLHGGHSDDKRNGLLATIFALQDGISRVSQLSGEKGGVGMMTAVEAVAELGDEEDDGRLTAVSIISGSSYVKLASPFLRPVERESLRFQWLNQPCRPNEPPSPQHAFILPVSFPGTIISSRFALNEEAISSDLSQ